MEYVCDDSTYAVVCAHCQIPSNYIYLFSCLNPVSFIDGNWALVFVYCGLLIEFRFNIVQQCPLRRFRVHLLIIMNVWLCSIIILYTGTGWVNSFGGWAGAKRGAGQWPGIGDKRKHATASSHIFLILTSLQLIKTAHGVQWRWICWLFSQIQIGSWKEILMWLRASQSIWSLTAIDPA